MDTNTRSRYWVVQYRSPAGRERQQVVGAADIDVARDLAVKALNIDFNQIVSIEEEKDTKTR